MNEGLDRLLSALAREIGGAGLVRTKRLGGKNNDVLALRFDDGRVLMVKRARAAASAPSFATSRIASGLLHEQGRVRAPEYLELPPGLFATPTLAYWRIPLPILEEVWMELSEPGRCEAMCSWGELCARIHQVRFPGYGSLATARDEPLSLAVALDVHLTAEQRPIYVAIWPAGVSTLDRLASAAPRVAEHAAGREGGVLVHGDLHMGNLLCEETAQGPLCRGVLDLESASAAPPEADLVRPLILYGPGFGDLPEPLLDALVEGYGAPLDPAFLSYYRAFHLLDLGLHCARRGLAEFAGSLAQSAGAAIDASLRALH